MPIVDPESLIRDIVREGSGFETYPVLTDGLRTNTVQDVDSGLSENEFFTSMDTYERWFLWGFSVWARDAEGNSDLVKE